MGVAVLAAAPTYFVPLPKGIHKITTEDAIFVNKTHFAEGVKLESSVISKSINRGASRQLQHPLADGKTGSVL